MMVKKQVKISAVIITFNEEKNIGRCLDSLKKVADEIVVVDSYSNDKTCEICEKYGVRFIRNRFKGHIEQKNFAMHQAKYDWVLSLDADEVLSGELTDSILKVKKDFLFEGYAFNRLTNYCGTWIRHCGWYPDTKLRLWDKRRGRWGGVNPHDRLIMDDRSQTGHLKGNLLHYSYHTIKEHVDQINSFSEIAANAAFKNGRKPNFLIDILLNPPFTFLKKYIIKLGFLDGYYGFVISIHTAYGKFLKYVKLKELLRK